MQHFGSDKPNALSLYEAWKTKGKHEKKHKGGGEDKREEDKLGGRDYE